MPSPVSPKVVPTEPVTTAMWRDVTDAGVRRRAVARAREVGAWLPRFRDLADPASLPAARVAALADVDPDSPHPGNLLRVHWWNDKSRKAQAKLPAYVELPRELTGVDARIVVLFGDRFPMIRAHKVLAAYACLVPRLVTGGFDPTHQRAIWPSTGNYCRGGVAISRILGCRGVAVLPTGMSAERFEWLSRWVADPADVVRTPGSESNVKEIYDECARLAKDDANVILNQFSEYANHVGHHSCTGAALAAVFEALPGTKRCAGFVSATGSAGTIAAGDALKERYGAKIVAGRGLEGPTPPPNGFCEHHAAGIGEQHVPLIPHLKNTDVIVGVSDRATNRLGLAFTRPAGHAYLAERRGVPAAILAQLPSFGYSGIANLLGAIRTARLLDLGREDVVMTVATDGAELYASDLDQRERAIAPIGYDQVHAAEAVGEHLTGCAPTQAQELRHEDRLRAFNLGYFTWVEQQGTPLAEFVARRDQAYWRGLRGNVAAWAVVIGEFNAELER